MHRFDGKPYITEITFRWARAKEQSNKPEVIAPNDTFETSANVGITIVLTEFDCLVDPTVSIAKVSSLRITRM